MIQGYILKLYSWVVITYDPLLNTLRQFPQVVLVVKNLPANAGDLRYPSVRKIPQRRKWQPTPVFLPRESHEQRSLVGYNPQGCKEPDMTEVTFHKYAPISVSHLSVFSLFTITVQTVPLLCWYPQLTVKCNSLRDVHCGYICAEPFPLSLRYEDIKKALKIFFGMAVIEGLIVIGLKKSSFLANCKAFEPEFILFDQSVTQNCSVSLSPEFSFLFF